MTLSRVNDQVHLYRSKIIDINYCALINESGLIKGACLGMTIKSYDISICALTWNQLLKPIKIKAQLCILTFYNSYQSKDIICFKFKFVQIMRFIEISAVLLKLI